MKSTAEDVEGGGDSVICVLLLHCPERQHGALKTVNQNILYPGRELNPERLQYEAAALSIWP